VFLNESDVVEIISSLRDKPARGAGFSCTFSNFKTCAHVGQADMGREVNGPLLAHAGKEKGTQLISESMSIAVGTAVASRPPHRSVLDELCHKVAWGHTIMILDWQ